MEINKKLKPCPFCGGEARFIHLSNFPDTGRVECIRCGIGQRKFLKKDKAIPNWNRRVDNGKL